MSGQQTFDLDESRTRPAHERCENNHTDRQSLCWNGNDEELGLLASHILSHGIRQGKDETVQVQHAVQAGNVVDYLATLLTYAQATRHMGT